MRVSDNNLTNRRILITGGTGFVGRSMLDHIASVRDDTTQVVVLSRSPQLFAEHHPRYACLPWLSCVQGDLLAFEPVKGNFTDVIHAAADTHGVSDEAAWIDQIITGTRTALDIALHAGAERFLMVSSGAVYGPQPIDLPALKEDYTGAPSTSELSATYGQAKRVAEQLCTIYHQRHGLEAVTARCFAFVGRHIPRNGPYAIENFISDALDPTQPSIRVKGDGTAIRTYLAAEDMARWMLRILTQGNAGEAYNVGSSQPISMADLASLVARLLAPHKAVEICGTGKSDTARSLYIPCTSKMEALGEEQRCSLEAAIRQTAAALGGLKHLD